MPLNDKQLHAGTTNHAQTPRVYPGDVNINVLANIGKHLASYSVQRFVNCLSGLSTRVKRGGERVRHAGFDEIWVL